MQIYSWNLSQMQATTAADPAVKRATSYFQDNITKVQSSSDLVNNYRLFTYAMQAYGLSDMSYAKAYMQKIMDGGVQDTSSLANRLSDPRFKAFTKAFDFGDLGAYAMQNDTNNANTTNAFIEQTLEDNVGQQNPGAQIALYFQRQAPHITSAAQIMSDKALFQFVQTAFGVPTFSATTDSAISDEEAIINNKVPMADLSDPAKVQNMVTRFAALWDLQNSNAAATSPALSVLTGGASGATSAMSLLQFIGRNYGRY
jgi:hypothetical protein